MFVELATAIAIFGMALVYLAVGILICRYLSYYAQLSIAKTLLLEREVLKKYKIDLKLKGDKKDLEYKERKEGLLKQIKEDLEG